MNDIKKLIYERRLFLDGSMGTMLGALVPFSNELPESFVLSRPEIVKSIHKSYYDAGSNIVCTDTFGANLIKHTKEELEKIIPSAFKCARDAMKESTNKDVKFVAFDVGPLGKLLKPYGELEFEDAISIFKTSIEIAEKCAPDLIFIETMNDSYETKAAVIAAKECSGAPLFVSNAYSENGRLLSGTSPCAMVAMLEGLGVDAIGANCSLGPAQLKGVAEELVKYASVPVFIKPNAGLPVIKDGKSSYDIDAEEFADTMAEISEIGVNILGGCCGTTPEYIEKTVKKCKALPFVKPEFKTDTLVSSYSGAVEIGKKPVLIGERINPTGKPKFKQALRDNNIDYILKEAINQSDEGADILDVNVGLPEIDEQALLVKCVKEIQAVCGTPLQLDSSDGKALEKALRVYNGKAVINSVNGKDENLSEILPLAAKYGGVVVALTLDENGIPDTAKGRFEIAEKILRRAEKYGIDKKNLLFDTLCMTVGTNPKSARITLEALKMIKEKLGAKTVLGVSNISFGLPQREKVNSSFFTSALENGLDAAIINPYSAEMMSNYHAFVLLSGNDENCAEYIAYTEKNAEKGIATPSAKEEDIPLTEKLSRAIISGMAKEAEGLSHSLLSDMPALEVVNSCIIPALDEVGKKFEQGKLFLPQLLMSAEAAKSAADEVKYQLAKAGSEPTRKPFVLATVKGDIHDIGKNIVKILLENYGFPVIDLGKDVAPEKVLEAVKKHNAPYCGLSALMTTTVPAMKETIELLKKYAPYCKTVVGGAVMTKEYAAEIGADAYANDAMETVRFAEGISK